MLLRVILLIIIGVAIYRFFGGKVPFLDKKEKSEVEKDFGNSIQGTSKCAYCGVYMTEDDALIYQRKAYCSNECLENHKKEK